MKVILSVFLCACLAHYFVGVSFGGGSENKNFKIKVAYLTKSFKKLCLQTDFADLATIHNQVDLGSTMNVSGMYVIGQFCEDFDLSDHVEDIVVVIPGRVDSPCFHFSNCKAIVIIKSELVVHGKSGCFDISIGQYFHSQVEYVQTFQVKNIVPHSFTCQKQIVDMLIRPNMLKRPVSDIWGPVEDLEKDAVEQISKLGEQFTEQINEEINMLRSELTKQFNEITQVVSKNTAVVTITESYGEVKKQLVDIDTYMARDVGIFEKYFHYFMHGCLILGIIGMVVLLYKIYKKAHAVYSIFRWIWAD